MRQQRANGPADAWSPHAQADYVVLNPAEQFSVVRAIRVCAGLHTLEEFFAWLDEDVESLLHHRAWACGLGTLHPEKYAAKHWFSSCNTGDRFSINRPEARILISPLLSDWLKTRRPIYIPGNAEEAAAGVYLFPQEPFDNAVLHCQMDLDNRWTSLFFFTNMGEAPGMRQRLLLDLLVPHLHATLCRVMVQELSRHENNESFEASPIGLTARELDILHHIRLGRTNSEIAGLMHKSVFTVNNQVVKVLAKLGVKNRTQAVFVAREKGLLHS